MKIALIAPLNFAITDKFIGGMENFIYKYALNLKSAGHEVTVFAPGGSKIPRIKIIECGEKGTYEDDDNSREFGQNAVRMGSVRSFRLMKDLKLKINDYDIFHFHPHNFLLLAMQDDDFAKKSVATIHVPIDSNIIKFTKEALNNDLEKLNLIMISDYQRQRAEASNIPVVDRVYNGIDLKDFEFSAQTKGYLGWLGRISPEKGLDVALQMAKEHNWKFKFCGSAFSNEYFKERIEPFIGDSIEYQGEAFGAEKSQFYGGCEVFLVPIQWDEPFGLTIIEAMACGTPVVAFNRGAMSELIIDGVNGYLIKPGDTKGFAEAVLKAKSLDRQKCREHVEKYFTIERMTQDYIKIYQKLLGDK